MSAELLADLARVKAVFQLRAISAVIGLPASGIEARSDETAQQAQPKARARPDAQNTPAKSRCI